MPTLTLLRPGSTEQDGSDSAAPVLGIDLGTTHSLVAVLRDGQPQVLTLPSGSPLLPSAVALDANGDLMVGDDALARLQRDPKAGARWFKRDMGATTRFKLGPHELGAIDLSALVLRQLRESATEVLGQPVSRAIVTVPAYFQEPQRAATVEAARLAGLQVMRLINEPTAAALAHGLRDTETERRVVVVDLGGGTLDVTLLDIFDGVIEIIASGGHGRLGGEDFTDLLVATARAEAGLPARAAGSTVDALLRAECEQAKRALSAHDRVDLALPQPGSADRWQEGKRLPLTRALFAGICAPLLSRVHACVADTLASADAAPRSVDEVLLVGGATRMPAVHDLVTRIFGRPPTPGPDPDLAVALGAAVQGGLADRDDALDDIVVTDVLAHSLGVEISKPGKRRHLAGYFMPVLHRNTTLPARRVERISTLHHEQTVIRVSIYQGEHRMVSRNLKLGEFEVTGIPKAKPGASQAVDLAFTHDVNGLLDVEGTVLATGQTARVLIEQQQGRLSPAERKRALERLERLKVPPRELLPNRLLLEQAHTRFHRLHPALQEDLDPYLLAFEDALDRQQPEEADAAALQLRQLLAQPAFAVGPQPRSEVDDTAPTADEPDP